MELYRAAMPIQAGFLEYYFSILSGIQNERGCSSVERGEALCFRGRISPGFHEFKPFFKGISEQNRNNTVDFELISRVIVGSDYCLPILQLNDQLMPNLSVTRPNRSAKNSFCRG